MINDFSSFKYYYYFRNKLNRIVFFGLIKLWTKIIQVEHEKKIE